MYQKSYKPMNKLYLMPTGEAEIIGQKKGFYLIKFKSGEVIYIPKDIIDKARNDDE